MSYGQISGHHCDLSVWVDLFIPARFEPDSLALIPFTLTVYNIASSVIPLSFLHVGRRPEPARVSPVLVRHPPEVDVVETLRKQNSQMDRLLYLFAIGLSATQAMELLQLETILKCSNDILKNDRFQMLISL
jgi:hypothetical protein